MKDQISQFVICINNKGYPASLIIRKFYEVLSDPLAKKLGQLRIIDESGEDYLYPEERFMKIDLPKEIEQRLAQAA